MLGAVLGKTRPTESEGGRLETWPMAKLGTHPQPKGRDWSLFAYRCARQCSTPRTISNGIFQVQRGDIHRRGAHVSYGPCWRGPSRTQRSLGDNGQGLWEVGQRPA
jgi:hypothetical protein